MMEGLKPNQIKALGLLVSGTSITDTAREVNVNRSAIYDWFELQTFKAGYNLLLNKMKKDTEAGVLSLSQKAIEAIERCLESENHQIAFKAALHVIGKVKAKSIGAIDPRDIIAKECTYAVRDNSGWQTGEELDFEEYEEVCKELGLDPDP